MQPIAALHDLAVRPAQRAVAVCRLVVTATLTGSVIGFAASEHASTSQGHTRLALQRQWTCSAGSAIFSSPAVASREAGGPAVVIACVSGAVRALCALSGQLLWRLQLQGQVFADLGVCPRNTVASPGAQLFGPSSRHSDGQGVHTHDTHPRCGLKTCSESVASCIVHVSTNSPDSSAWVCPWTGVVVGKVGRRDAGPAASAAIPMAAHRMCGRGAEAVQDELHGHSQWLQVVTTGALLLMSGSLPSQKVDTNSVSAPTHDWDVRCIEQGGVECFSGVVMCMCGKMAMLGKRDNKVHLLRIQS